MQEEVNGDGAAQQISSHLASRFAPWAASFGGQVPQWPQRGRPSQWQAEGQGLSLKASPCCRWKEHLTAQLLMPVLTGASWEPGCPRAASRSDRPIHFQGMRTCALSPPSYAGRMSQGMATITKGLLSGREAAGDAEGHLSSSLAANLTRLFQACSPLWPSLLGTVPVQLALQGDHPSLVLAHLSCAFSQDMGYCASLLPQPDQG